MIRLPVAVAAALLAALGGRASAEEPVGPLTEYGGLVVDAPEGVEIDRVSIDNPLGDVRIAGHDRDTIKVEAFKRAPDVDSLERLKVSFSSDSRGSVAIGTELKAGEETRPVPAGSVGIDLVVHIPRAARPRVSVWNGQVEVEGVDNGAEVSSNEGDIEVKRVSGAIRTQSAHGRTQFEELVGATIDARAVEGDMELAVVRGDRLEAIVHQGKVQGRSVRFREIRVRTFRGDIRLETELVAGGRYEITSYRGNVQVVLASRTPARVMASARSGRVAMSDELGAVTGDGGSVLGQLGRAARLAKILVRTRQGNVNVAVARF